MHRSLTRQSRNQSGHYFDAETQALRKTGNASEDFEGAEEAAIPPRAARGLVSRGLE